MEVLKTLNWGEAEFPSQGGVEPSEILTRLQKGPCPSLTSEALDEAIATLVLNRMAESREDSEYAWDRGRNVGRRYTLTFLGKQYLLRQLQRNGRIPRCNCWSSP